MQNRFTAKDFLYVLIGVVACLLLLLNTFKTDREAELLDAVNTTLKSQQATLSELEGAIATLGSGGGLVRIDPSALSADSAGGAATGGSAATGSDRIAITPSGEFRANVATRPSYQPGADIRFSGASSSVNREGRPQRWQTAPDAGLPGDFAPGDSIVAIWHNEPQTLTPYVSRDRYATDIHREVLEQMVWIDLEPPFDYVPGLARAWEVSEDGLTLTFHLFPNATWSDGQPITADDVVFTFDLVFNEQIDAPVARSYFKDNIASYEALDPHTVRFHMKQTYFNAVGVVGENWILPKHIYGQFDPETYNTKIRDLCVGSGPWVLDSWEKGSQIVLRRNENYWGPKPALERHVIRIIQNELAGLQEFRAGNADVQVDPTAEQFVANRDSAELKERGGQAISYYTPLAGYSYIGYNLRRPIFADKRTRQALTMLIDRQEMIDTIRGGLGEVVTGPFYFRAPQYDKTVEPWPYDPERAKTLLAEMGWQDSDNDGIIDMDLDGDGDREPFEFTFLMPTSVTTERYQRYVQDKFALANIKVNLNSMEWSVFDERLTERDFDMVLLAWTASPESDPYQIWHSSQAENRGSNHVGFVNAEADRIIEEARITLDFDKRMELWHRFHRLLHEEQPYTFLFSRPRLVFADERFQSLIVHGYRLYPSEWYVPAANQLR